MSKKSIQLTVVLPAYNEEDVIARVLTDTWQYLNHSFSEFEVVVVDDGSTDKTAEIVDGLRQKLGRIRLVKHDTNRGYGEALRSGFDAAGLEWILLMDSDGQFSIESLSDFLVYAKDYEFVAGYRYHRSDNIWRNLMTRLYNQLVKLLFGEPVRDVGCAFKLFKRSTWLKAQPITMRDHKIFIVEWLLNTRQAGVVIKELSVKHWLRTTGSPTGARLGVMWLTVRSLIKLYVGRKMA